MKIHLAALVILTLALSGCAAAITAVPTLSPLNLTANSPLPAPSSTAPTTGAIERTPDPANEMLVTGSIKNVMENAILVQTDNMGGQDIVVTMLDRAEFAKGVSTVFTQGNYVRIITSNKLAKSLPPQAAARLVLDNESK